MTFVFVVNVGKARVFLVTVSHAAHAISRIQSRDTSENARAREKERKRERGTHT